MSLQAKPNINGNTRDDFAAAYAAIGEAAAAVETAFAKLRSDVVNGRNYQHTSQDAQIEDMRRLSRDAIAIRALLGTLQSDIVDAIGD